jgi:hypothetical protein
VYELKTRIQKTTVVSFVLMFLCSCARSYSSQYFSYPPDSKPHENDWTYFCKIIIWDPFGNRPVEKGKRKIEIVINDKNKNKVLEDKFEIESASVETKIKWMELKQITFDLYEVGHKHAEDEYNKLLIKEGPKHLVTLNYICSGKKYIKSITEQG